MQGVARIESGLQMRSQPRGFRIARPRRTWHERVKMGISARELVLDMLLETERGGGYENLLLRDVLNKYDYLEEREKAFAKRLTQGVTERRIQLDYVLDFFSSVPVRRMKPLIRNVLRMGAFQILFMEGVPDAAACNEAVKLAARRHFQPLKGFVNGVLRSLSCRKDQIPWPDREKEPFRYLSVYYSMPEWIVRMWASDYGTEKTERMLQGLLEERPVAVRISPRMTEEEKRTVLDELGKAGADPRRHPLLSYAYLLKRVGNVAQLPGFAEGKFAVQDVSSMLVAECAGLGVGVEKNILVLDVCAAPGGKAVHAAECLVGRGIVQARDVSEKKAAYIRENADRMGLSNLEVRVWDATMRDPAMTGTADVLLADLPCSGLGVIGRKADIKYRVSPESLKEVVALQRKILETVWEYVKPGGILVYSTCTINREENERMAEWFSGMFPFAPVSLKGRLPEEIMAGQEGEGMCQLLPGFFETDGFFLSCFRRLS